MENQQEKSPAGAGLEGVTTGQCKPEFQALKDRIAYLDSHLQLLRAALALPQRDKPIVPEHQAVLESDVLVTLLKPAVSVLRKLLVEQDRRLTPKQTDRTKYPLDVRFVVENPWIVAGVIEAADSVRQEVSRLDLADYQTFLILKSIWLSQ